MLYGASNSVRSNKVHSFYLADPNTDTLTYGGISADTNVSASWASEVIFKSTPHLFRDVIFHSKQTVR